MAQLNGYRMFDGDMSLAFKGNESLFELEGKRLIDEMSRSLEIKPGHRYRIHVTLYEEMKDDRSAPPR